LRQLHRLFIARQDDYDGCVVVGKGRVVKRSIILIGPSKAGKTTLCTLLADALGWAAVDLDALRWKYYAEIGYDPEQAMAIRQEGGLKAIVAHWKPYDIHAVERVLADYPEQHVIAFGAGHSVYEEPSRMARAEAALKPFPHVVRLIPAADMDESMRILEDRLRRAEPELGSFSNIMAFNHYFLSHPSNARLSTLTIYNAGQTPAETVSGLMERLAQTE
jgi:hypothetical protein